MAEDLEEGIQDFLNVDLPEVGPITQEMVQATQENSIVYGANARTAMGRIWTTKEYEVRRQRILNIPLP